MRHVRDVLECDTAWHGMAWDDTARHGMGQHSMAWHGMAWHNVGHPRPRPLQGCSEMEPVRTIPATRGFCTQEDYEN